MERVLSPKKLAQAVGVSESSLKRWADEGLIHVTRTAGGHRRIAIHEAMRFIRDTQLPLLHPQLLGLDVLAATSRDGEQRRAPTDTLYAALVDGDIRRARAQVVKAYLAGESVAELCDRQILPALRTVNRTPHSDLDAVVVDRHRRDICRQVLNFLRCSMRLMDENAPIALGGSLGKSNALVYPLMAATTLGEMGFADFNLGTQLSPDVIKHAIQRYQPALLWLVSSGVDEAKFVGNVINELWHLTNRTRAIHLRLDDMMPQGPWTTTIQQARSLEDFAAAAQPYLATQSISAQARKRPNA